MKYMLMIVCQKSDAEWTRNSTLQGRAQYCALIKLRLSKLTSMSGCCSILCEWACLCYEQDGKVFADAMQTRQKMSGIWQVKENINSQIVVSISMHVIQ